MAAYTVTISSGGGVGIGVVPWAGAEARRPKVDWLPPPNVPITLDGKTMNPVWYRAFFEMFERRLGGISAATVPSLQTTVSQVQTLTVATVAYADEAVAYTRGVAESTAAVKEVAQNNGLSGAESVPDVPDPPIRRTPSGTPL